MGNSSVRQYSFMRVWIDSPQSISTHLGAVDVAARLRGTGRYDEDGMKIIVRTGWAKDEYVVIALKGNTSNGLQRFFFCRLTATEEGAVLAGEIRSRIWARGFLTFMLGLWCLFFTIAAAITLVAVITGQWSMIWSDAQHMAFAILLGLAFLGFANFSMATTAGNQEFLLGWLERKITGQRS